MSIVDWNGRSVLEPKEATRYLRFHKPFTMEIDVDRSYKSRFGSEIPSILGTWHWAELTINGHHLDRIEFPYLNAIEKGQHYIEVGFTFPRIPKLA